ncbi:MAG: hopD2 1 [Gammaproteobacteria bacterium]|jgi:protein-tyrosine phosphatase|nr:hopD2 1 [Gammaproteobacteria bacterium]
MNDPSHPELILDVKNQASMLPKQFRTHAGCSPIEEQAITSRLIIGSAQFSELELVEAIKGLANPVHLIDLRQESHGFIEGHAISWYQLYNWANRDLTAKQAEQDENQRLAMLAGQARISIGRLLKIKGQLPQIESRAMICTEQQVISEEALAKKYNLNYTRLRVTDHCSPDALQVDKFIELVRGLSKNVVLYFHCRGGKGRTTTFMSLYDIMHYAKQMSLPAIIARQRALGGSDLAKIPETASYKHELVKQRWAFLQQFYNYCLANEDNFATAWSSWQQNSLI